MAGAAIRIGFAVVAIPLLIRIIGVAEYGLWTLVSTVIAVVGLAEAGLSVATTVFVSRDLASDNAKELAQTLTVSLAGIIALSTVAAVVLWVLAPAVVAVFPVLTDQQRAVAIAGLRFGSVVVWTRLVQQTIVGLEQAFQRYGAQNAVNSLQALLISGGALVVAMLGGRTAELMAWNALVGVLTLTIHAVFARRLLAGRRLRPAWDAARGVELLRYSGMTWLASVGSALFSQCDRLIVGGMLGTTVLGVYAAITTIAMQVNAFSALAVQPLLPSLSGLRSADNVDNGPTAHFVRHAVHINTVVAAGMAGALIAFSPFLMQFMVGTLADAENSTLFRVALVIFALYSLNAVGYYILLGLDEAAKCMTYVLLSGGATLALVALGTSAFGLMGAILGSAGYLSTMLLNYAAARKLELPVVTWTRWYVVPLGWLLVVFVLHTLVTLSFPLTVILATLELGVLGAWFLATEQLDLRRAWKLLRV